MGQGWGWDPWEYTKNLRDSASWHSKGGKRESAGGCTGELGMFQWHWDPQKYKWMLKLYRFMHVFYYAFVDCLIPQVFLEGFDDDGW